MQKQNPVILSARGKSPQISDSVWLAPNCTVVGEVTLGEESTVWFGAVIRGDVASIKIGRRVTIMLAYSYNQAFCINDFVFEFYQ